MLLVGLHLPAVLCSLTAIPAGQSERTKLQRNKDVIENTKGLCWNFLISPATSYSLESTQLYQSTFRSSPSLQITVGQMPRIMLSIDRGPSTASKSHSDMLLGRY